MTTVYSEFGMRTTRLVPGRCEWNHAKLIEVPVIDVVTKVDPVGYWLSQSSEEIKTNCDLMKIYILWQVLISKSDVDQQQHPWGLQVKTMKDLDYIEILEDLADLFKKVASRWYFIEDILRIGDKMDTSKRKTRIAAMVDAVNWMLDTGDQAVYKKIMSAHDNLRGHALFTFFYQYSFLLNKMGEECCTLADKVKKHECEECDRECDRKKICGNVAFEKGQYISAVQYYTAAMQYSPHNHILFGNRALCFIRMGDYWNALCDGKKAIVLKNTWPKTFYGQELPAVEERTVSESGEEWISGSRKQDGIFNDHILTYEGLIVADKMYHVIASCNTDYDAVRSWKTIPDGVIRESYILQNGTIKHYRWLCLKKK